MKEVINKYEDPEVAQDKGWWGILLKESNGGSSFRRFSSEEDANEALRFARFCQYAGILLRADRKILSKKIN